MKISFWKKVWSYFSPIHLETVGSDYNETLSVYFTNGEYQLTTDHAIYSYGRRYDNYFKTFKTLNKDLPDDAHVLILGLGLGSIPFMLEASFQKDYNYTAVEIDDSIVYLANKYVLSDLQSEITTYTTDALIFMNQNLQKYDIIAMDIFVDDKIPEVFATKEFLNELKASLTPNGWLMFNRLYLYEKDRIETDRYYSEVFLSVFPSGQALEINGNKILLNR